MTKSEWKSKKEKITGRDKRKNHGILATINVDRGVA